LLSGWADERFADQPGVRTISCQQWTPDLAEEVAVAETVLFVDCSLEEAPGQIMVREIAPAPIEPGLVTHHLGASELLCVAQDIYGRLPRRACLLAVGASSVEVGEDLSAEVRQALPEAYAMLELTVERLMSQRA